VSKQEELTAGFEEEIRPIVRMTTEDAKGEKE
jgi:hypothetical protein